MYEIENRLNMNTISELWINSKDTFNSKSLSQILSFAGDGKLKDDSLTSKEFREFLDQIPSYLIKQFADDCLIQKFDDSGFALQDLINQIGSRLGFSVEYGLYRGKQKSIGFDGIWISNSGHSIVLEVKTTDTYRINLDTIAEYRNKLIEESRIGVENSSILIVVGREDTGDLEAQIRGSQHAWDVRLISTDSLIQLLIIKEKLNDNKTIQQINEILKPREYTRIDKLIELIFLTSQDLLIEAPEIIDEDVDDEGTDSKDKIIPVEFHDECLSKIQIKLNSNLIKQSRVSFSNNAKSIGLVCTISKPYKQGKQKRYWFAFHPHQKVFLSEFEQPFVAFGCGSAENTFLIPYKDFESAIKNFGTTEREDRMYWHVIIRHRGDKYFLAQPRVERGSMIDITNYKI